MYYNPYLPVINPIAFSIGPIDILWYSLAYITGTLFGWWYIKKLITIFKIKDLNHKNIDDFVNWLIAGIIIGGRLGYVIFYDPAKYLANPIEIFQTYKGGMSFHGATLGVFISSLIFCRINKIKFLLLSDLILCAAPFGIIFGRIANFINGELYGKSTNMPWGVIFYYGGNIPRHPSQLYEALLEGLVIFIIINYLVFYYKLLEFRGKVTGLFLTLYGTFRIIIENFREPTSKLEFISQYFTMGQILSIPMMIIGFYLIFSKQKRLSELN